MNKICYTSLIAIVLTANPVISQAKPIQEAIAEARVKTMATGGRYMQLNRTVAVTCADTFDGGENRFDRMYSNIGPRICNSRY